MAETARTTELHIAPATTSPAQARDFVERYCHQRALTYLVDDIRLVVSELVTNAVIHVGTGLIRVKMEKLPSHLKLTVHDDSLDAPGFNRAGRLPPGPNDESGRGLWLVDKCCAEWGTDRASGDGKSTWALFALRPQSSSVARTLFRLRSSTASHPNFMSDRRLPNL